MVGRQYEDIAVRFLEANRFRILGRNYRIRGGEIDIVAQRGKRDIYFIEVRHRGKRSFARAFESITPKKKQTIIKTALFFIKDRRLPENMYYHFSVVDVGDREVEDVLWDAFTIEDTSWAYFL